MPKLFSSSNTNILNKASSLFSSNKDVKAQILPQPTSNISRILERYQISSWYELSIGNNLEERKILENELKELLEQLKPKISELDVEKCKNELKTNGYFMFYPDKQLFEKIRDKFHQLSLLGETNSFISGTNSGKELFKLLEKIRGIKLKNEGYTDDSFQFVQREGRYNTRGGNRAHFDYPFSIAGLWNLSSLPVQFIPKKHNQTILKDIQQELSSKEYTSFTKRGITPKISMAFTNYPNLVKTCPAGAFVFILGGEIRHSPLIAKSITEINPEMHGVENAIIHAGLGENSVGLSDTTKKELENLPRSLVMFRTEPLITN